MTTSGSVIASVPAGVSHNASSQPNTASTSTDSNVTYNQLPPSVTINQDPTQQDPTSATPIVFDVDFSEPVTGFTASDVTLSGMALPATATITDNSLGYTVSVSGMSTSGDIIADIPAGGCCWSSAEPAWRWLGDGRAGGTRTSRATPENALVFAAGRVLFRAPA